MHKPVILNLKQREPSPTFGTQEHPINIYGEEEENQIMRQRKENARNAEILQKAKLSKDPTDIILALVKTKMRGSTKQKNEAVHH